MKPKQEEGVVLLLRISKRESKKRGKVKLDTTTKRRDCLGVRPASLVSGDFSRSKDVLDSYKKRQEAWLRWRSFGSSLVVEEKRKRGRKKKRLGLHVSRAPYPDQREEKN
jgi:hypothetical protein